jgi:arylsulfatase A-like enzyme
VVLLLIDDAGFDDVFSQRLPHVQSLARRGASFGSAYVTAPQCSPSRAAILTGKQCV